MYQTIRNVAAGAGPSAPAALIRVNKTSTRGVLGDLFLQILELLAIAAGLAQDFEPLLRLLRLARLQVQLAQIFICAQMQRIERERPLVVAKRLVHLAGLA